MTAIAFALNPLMSGDEALKEMHAQIAASNSSNKATMQAILVVVMSYERICSIARADAAAAGVDYVPHTLAQFQTLMDRAEHAAYIAAAPPPAHADPFDEHLADAADNRDRRARQKTNPTFELSCFWCGAKGHTLMECPDPAPNAKAKAARDMVPAAQENKTKRFQRAETRRLAGAATNAAMNAFVTDDEDTDDSEI